MSFNYAPARLSPPEKQNSSYVPTISNRIFPPIKDTWLSTSVISRNSSERETAESYPYANAGYYPYGTGAKLKVPRANICGTRNERSRFRSRGSSSRPDPLCLISHNERSVPETDRNPTLKFPAFIFLEQIEPLVALACPISRRLLND